VNLGDFCNRLTRNVFLIQRLYDLALQLDDMAEAGIDVSVLSCLLGWSAPLEECRFINDDLAAVQKKYRAALSAGPKRRYWTASRRWMSCAARLTILGCAA
jgi:hypothetical protein